jgi:hypothetical protein
MFEQVDGSDLRVLSVPQTADFIAGLRAIRGGFLWLLSLPSKKVTRRGRNPLKLNTASIALALALALAMAMAMAMAMAIHPKPSLEKPCNKLLPKTASRFAYRTKALATAVLAKSNTNHWP